MPHVLTSPGASGSIPARLARLWDWLFAKRGPAFAAALKVQTEVGPRMVSRIFLSAFLFSCLLFWWLISLLYREFLGVEDPVTNQTLLLSFATVAVFLVGYALPSYRKRGHAVPERVLVAGEQFSYGCILALAGPVFAISLYYARTLAAASYGSAVAIPFAAQLLFYPYLFLGLFFLGVVRAGPGSQRRIALVCALIIVPRLVITIHYARFFAAQGIIPVVFIAIARGWLRITWKYLVLTPLLALAMIFLPALSRGDDMSGNDGLIRFFAAGSSLKLFQDNKNLSLAARCPPMLVSFTAMLVPFHELGVCTIDYEGMRGVPATLERILTVNEIGNVTETGVGTGSNFMLELYLSGGTVAVLAGSLIFGYACRLLVSSLAHRSIFVGVWAMCLPRALFTPRSNLGYVFELVPSYVFASLVVAGVAYAMSIAAGSSLTADE